MTQRAIILLCIAVIMVFACFLMDLPSTEHASLLAVETKNRERALTNESWTQKGLDITDVNDIEIKSHLWVEEGYSPLWTANGRYMVFHKNHILCAMDPLAKKLRALGKGLFLNSITSAGNAMYGFRIKPGSSNKSSEGQAKEIVAIDFETGKIDAFGQGNFDNVLWSPDGKYVAVENSTGEWLLINSRNMNQRSLKGAIFLDWSPNGERFLCAANDGSIYVMNLDGGSAIRIGKDTILSIKNRSIKERFGYSTTHKSKICGFAGKSGRIWFWDDKTGEIKVMNADGGEPKVVAVPCQRPRSNRPFSPEGKWVFYKPRFGGGNRWKQIGNGETYKFGSPGNMPNEPSVSVWFPNEEQAIVSRNKYYYIWSPNANGDNKEVLLGTQDSPWLLPAISADSRFIAFCVGKPIQFGIANSDLSKVNVITKDGIEGLELRRQMIWSPTGDALAYYGYIHDSNGKVLNRGIGVITLGSKNK